MKVTQIFLALVLLGLASQGLASPIARQLEQFLGVPQTKMDVLGLSCAACTVITGMTDQLAEVHKETYGKALQRFCKMLPDPFDNLCGAFRLIFGSQIVSYLGKGETPDTACIIMKLCDAPKPGQPICHLYPSKLAQRSSSEVQAHLHSLMQESGAATRADPRLNPCSIPLLGNLICSYLNVHAFSMEYPKDDDDKDGFSESFGLRGSAWRGKDCNDKGANTYPGKKPNFEDGVIDSNCNGISGQDTDAVAFEQKYCSSSQAKGLIVLGDSVAANFHVPGEWFNASLMNADLFKYLPDMMDNSLNWPHTSVYTGYQNVTLPIIDGLTDSLYLRLRDRNLCNHRDYQNLGVNGATIPEANAQAKTLKRNTLQDKPAIVLFSFIGNDVCKYHPNPAEAETSTPAEARSGLLDTMETLDAKLAPGSHVIVVGIADARPFFAGIHDQIHPFGSLRKDVTYGDFYDYLSCIDINPCRGWLTRDEKVHNVTAQLVVDINTVLENTVKESKGRFRNFEMIYLPNPIMDVIAQQEALGGQGWQLVEKFDGFHPNQKGHALLAGAAWKILERDYPEILGPVNENNDLIRQRFGLQGGH